MYLFPSLGSRTVPASALHFTFSKENLCLRENVSELWPEEEECIILAYFSIFHVIPVIQNFSSQILPPLPPGLVYFKFLKGGDNILNENKGI